MRHSQTMSSMATSRLGLRMVAKIVGAYLGAVVVAAASVSLAYLAYARITTPDRPAFALGQWAAMFLSPTIVGAAALKRFSTANRLVREFRGLQPD